FARFLALPQLAAADSVLLYCGMGTEPDTGRLIPLLLAQGKRVALPRCLPEHGMEARLVSAETVLVRHPYGMLEPGEDCPTVLKGELGLILVPGLCFDGAGYRLGQGGGYYDRYLADFCGSTVGLCRRFLLQNRVPRDPLDLPVDVVLTEAGSTKRTLSGPLGAADK
ncbi:MAG: 5-formyltetrahydrofolate cyclo-ligase, partial [Pseudoflavonifractor sp.]